MEVEVVASVRSGVSRRSGNKAAAGQGAYKIVLPLTLMSPRQTGLSSVQPLLQASKEDAKEAATLTGDIEPAVEVPDRRAGRVLAVGVVVDLRVKLRPSRTQVGAVQESEGRLEVLLAHVALDRHHVCGGLALRRVEPRDGVVAHAAEADLGAVRDVEGRPVPPGLQVRRVERRDRRPVCAATFFEVR